MSKQIKEYDIEFNINGNNSIYVDIVETLSPLSSKILIEDKETRTSANAKSLLNIARLNIVPKNKYTMYIIGCDNFYDDCIMIERVFSKYAKVVLKEWLFANKRYYWNCFIY